MLLTTEPVPPSPLLPDAAFSVKSPCERFTLADALDRWMTSNRVRLKGATQNKYQYLISVHILPELGNYALSQLDAAAINAFLHRKRLYGRLDGAGGLSSSYVRSIMLILNAALDYAAKEGFCDPLKTPLHKPSAEPKPIRVLN